METLDPDPQQSSTVITCFGESYILSSALEATVAIAGASDKDRGLSLRWFASEGTRY